MIVFFKQKTAYEMRISDWSSDVCSSDLQSVHPGEPRPSLPVGGVGGLAPFDMQQGGAHQVLRPGQAQRRAAKRTEAFRKKRPADQPVKGSRAITNRPTRHPTGQIRSEDPLDGKGCLKPGNTRWDPHPSKTKT